MKNVCKAVIIAACISVMSCKTHNIIALDETFVEGGEISIGNGLLFDRYESQVE